MFGDDDDAPPPPPPAAGRTPTGRHGHGHGHAAATAAASNDPDARNAEAWSASTELLSTDPNEASVTDVCNWLRALKMQDSVVALFQAQDVDGAMLMELDEVHKESSMSVDS